MGRVKRKVGRGWERRWGGKVTEIQTQPAMWPMTPNLANYTWERSMGEEDTALRTEPHVRPGCGVQMEEPT